MPVSPLTFLGLPTELKFEIFGELDGRSLLKMSRTCKSLNELICTSHECNLVVEMTKSELIPATHTGSSAIARRAQMQAHLTSRLTLPIESRHCDSITALATDIYRERLFKGYFVCIITGAVLVWDICRPNPTQTPRVSMVLPGRNILDVVLAPRYNLYVSLSQHPGNHSATITFFELFSTGQRPHSGTASPVITIPERSTMMASRDRQFLTLNGPLLALVYCRGQNFRRGIVWNWRTGNRLYDSGDSDSTSRFHDLQLLTLSRFLVTASTPSYKRPPTEFRGWIELHICDSPASSRLIAEFHLPESDKSTKYDLEALEFHSSESQDDKPCNHEHEQDMFPFFISDPSTSVQVLHIWYRPRPGRPRLAHGGAGSRMYLVISNMVFGSVLQNLARNASFPLRIGWDDWGPPWTSMWDYGELGVLSGISSVCGSRICTVSHPADGCIELFVIDFNMNFPCTERNCTNPLVHFTPKIFRSSKRIPLWARVVHTWLPFHTQRKRITIPRTDDDWEMCTIALMDEVRIVLSTCASESPTLNPSRWTIVHMLHDRQNTSPVLPWSETINEIVTRKTAQHDAICRLCREKPHTDAHILLGCTAHPEVVQLRQNLIEHISHFYPALYSVGSNGSFDEMLDGIKAHRDTEIRVLVSSLVTQIYQIYQQLPRCSELVPVEQGDPAADTLFVVT